LQKRKLAVLRSLKNGLVQQLYPQHGTAHPHLRFRGHTPVWRQRGLGELLDEFSIKSKKEDEHIVLSSTNAGMEVRDGRVSGASNIGYKIINTGELVLSPQNLWLGNINVNNIGVGLVSPSYKTFRFTGVDANFIEPQFRSKRMLEEYKNASTQGASVVRRNLEVESFEQIPIKTPSLSEQLLIGALFAALTNQMETQQVRLNSLELAKEYMLREMFI
jgi:type I restriction enzyme, S subunit